MKKALFSVLMVLVLTLAFALGVSANEVVETGNLTETVRYTLYADGKMVIEGTGELTGYYYDLGGSFHNIFPDVTQIEVGEGITSLGETCFYYMKKLSTVSLPSTLKSIGNCAFGNCSELQNVILPDGLEIIGDNAFLNCSKLTRIVIPASVKTVMDNAFGNCDDLVEFIFLGGPLSMSPLSLYARDKYGEDVSATAYYPDNGGWTQKDLIYPGRAVTWIPYTLDSQGNLIYQKENAFVSTIEQVKSGFFGADGNWYIDDAGVLHIQGNEGKGRIRASSTMNIYWENITGLIVEPGVKAFSCFFDRYEHLRTVTFTDALAYYPEFIRCEKLESFDFGSSASTLPRVSYAHEIRELVIPETVTYINNEIFFYCQGMESVTFLGNAPATIGNSCFAKVGELTIYYPASDDSWTETIMQKLSGSQAVWIPYTVDKDGNRVPDSNQAKRYVGVVRAWENSGVISTLYGDGTLCVEGTGIFNAEVAGRDTYAVEVRRVEIGDGITGIGSFALAWCGKLTEVTLPDGLEEIGENAFFGCASLTAIDLPDSLKTIGEEAFRRTGLTSVVIPDGVKKIGDFAFTECRQLSEITLNEGLEYIGEQAFRYTEICEVIIPSTVLDIEASAFSDTKLDSITFLTKNLTRISRGCFSNTKFKIFTIPEGVQTIERYAFGESYELEKVILPESLVSMEDMAFAYSDAIQLVIFKSSLPSMVATPFCHVGYYAIAYPEQYADSYKDGNLEYLIAGGAFVSEKVSYTLGENGEMLAPKVDDSEALTNLAKVRKTYPEGYSLGQYSVSNLNLANVLGYGSQAFAYMLSDALYPDMPSETIWDVKFEDVQLGDILRLPGMARSAGSGRAVVVIEKNGDTVTVAQGDWHETPDAPGTVHWGEVLSRQQVEMAEYRITRHVSDLLADPGDIPTYEPEAPVMPENVTEDEMQSLLYSLKDSLPEGFPYTTDITYATQAEGMENDLSGYGQGCSAFAYWVSDMAFGTAPMRYVTDIDYDDIMVGDILHYDPDPGDDTTHVVVVLEVYQECLVTVEANYGETVHWGSVFTEDQVESMLGYYTRYPEGTTHEERAEYEGEISDKHQIDGFFQMMEEDTVVETGHTVFEALSGQELTFDYEIPENGAVMLIFFFNWCGYSDSLLSELDGCAWLDNPALEIIAVETAGASSEMMADYISRVTPNSSQYIQYFTASSYLHSAYQNTYVAEVRSSPCIIIITDNNGTPAVSRSRAGYISTEALYGCLTSISEGFAFHEGHEHDFVFKRTVKPTCDEQGYAVYHCDCGKEEHRDFVDALGHSWVEATCAAPKTCSVCQKTEGAALKHEYRDDICIHCGEEMKGIMGDLDGNGKLSYNDALVILRGSIGLVKLDDTQKLLADVDGNGIVNYNDALTVLRRSIGLA